MAKIVITGGAGFIGSQLGKSLIDEGHDVVLIDNMSYGYLDNLVVNGKTFGRFLGIDIRSPDLVKHFANVDYVFHFAGISALPVCQEKPLYAMDVNVGGTANVLEAARLAGVKRVIFASTGAIYENNTTFPNKESDPVRPTLTYPISKFQAEKLCDSYRELYGMEIVMTRYFNVYGPHQDFMRVSPPLMSYIVRELLYLRQPVLHSDGTQERDCVFVDDVNRLNKLCMTHPRAVGETFNVGSGVATSVRQIFALLAKAMNSKLEAVFRPATNYWDAYPNLFLGKYPLKQEVVEKEVRKYTLSDTSKAFELLGWRAEVSIEEGLARTAHYAMALTGKLEPRRTSAGADAEANPNASIGTVPAVSNGTTETTRANPAAPARRERRRPRKVLHVLNSASGGAALSTIGLMNAFRKEGIASCAVCNDAGGPEERALIREACQGDAIFTPLYWSNKKIRSPLWKRPLLEVRELLTTGFVRGSAARVTDFARAQHVDLIHTNTLVTPEGGMAARKLGLPHVWHLRELVGPGNTFRFRGEGPKMGRYLAEHCSKILANSEVCAAQIRDWLPPGLLAVVSNGIDVRRFTPRQTPPNTGRFVVALVSNLSSRWKKHRLFVEAAALVDRSLPIEWRIYGHDPSHGGTVVGDLYVDELRGAIARHGLSDRFRWPGFVADPVEIMSEVDLIVHTADQESFGRVVVEAMSAGLPVVGVRAGGVGDIVEEEITGLLAEPDDARGIARHVERLAKDPALCRSMGLAGRKRAESHYSMEACAAGVLRVYEEAMDRPVGARPQSASPATS